MRATLPPRFALALDSRAPRRSLGGAQHAAASQPAALASASAAVASVTTAGPIGQALLEKVTAVSAKLESILGRSDVRRSRSRPMTSRQPSSLGEKLMELTERLGHLDELLEDFQRGAFQPPLRRPGAAAAATPAAPAPMAPVVAQPLHQTPRAPGETQLVEASVKAVAKSLLDAVRHRSASAGYRSQFTPVQLVRQPSASRSATPITPHAAPTALHRVRSPPPASLGSTSVGLTPPPGLFLPSGFATPMTPAAPAPVAPAVAPFGTPLGPSVAPGFNGCGGPPVPQPLAVMPQFTFESLAQSASRHLNGTPRPVPTSPSSRSNSAAPPARLQGHAEMKIRKWLETIPIGNGSERGWDDAQIRQIASFANKNHLSHLPPEQLYQRFVEHQVAEAENA